MEKMGCSLGSHWGCLEVTWSLVGLFCLERPFLIFGVCCFRFKWPWVITKYQKWPFQTKRPNKDEVASIQPQWDLNEHPIFCSGMDGGMTQGHLNLKHCTPKLKDAKSRRKRPTKDQVTSRQPQWDPNEHPIFCSGMDGGMTQGHLNLKHCTPNIKDAKSRRKRPTKDPQLCVLFVFSWSLVGL